jgi:hypothetical protein
MASRLMRAAAAGAVALGVMAAAAAPAAAVGPEGNQGCTPGYWKNHTNNWEEYSSGQFLGTPAPGAAHSNTTALFRNPDSVPKKNAIDDSPTAVSQYRGTTALQALQFNGGGGVDGAARILLRAAVAAWLNAQHDGVAYPLHRWERSQSTGLPSLYSMIDTALDSGDRQKMLDLAALLDGFNNGPGGCPLN